MAHSTYNVNTTRLCPHCRTLPTVRRDACVPAKIARHDIQYERDASLPMLWHTRAMRHDAMRPSLQLRCGTPDLQCNVMHPCLRCGTFELQCERDASLPTLRHTRPSMRCDAMRSCLSCGTLDLQCDAMRFIPACPAAHSTYKNRTRRISAHKLRLPYGSNNDDRTVGHAYWRPNGVSHTKDAS